MFYIWVLDEVQDGSDRCDNMLRKKKQIYCSGVSWRFSIRCLS